MVSMRTPYPEARQGQAQTSAQVGFDLVDPEVAGSAPVQRLKKLQALADQRAPVQRFPILVNNTTYMTDGAIAGTPYTVAHRPFGTDRKIVDRTADTISGLTLTQADGAALIAAAAGLVADGVANVTDLVDGIEKAQMLGVPNSVTIARLGMIRTNVNAVIHTRIQADHAHIQGLFPPGTIDPAFATAFASIEIPGSDPHKGGQVVAFINYNNALAPGQTVRLVYKPGDLRFDQLLYDSAGSVAATLGGDLASYRIDQRPADALAAANPALTHYGYMEFVNSGGPTTAAQVTSVFRSMGANLAMAYIFGLRDIHQENFVLLNDRIQFIDMEAGTSTFTGFAAMEIGTLGQGLPKALKDKIATALGGLTNQAVRGWGLTDNNVRFAMRAGFMATLAASRTGGPNAAAMNAAVQNTTHTETRFVPFSTRELQQLAGLFHGELAAPSPAIQNSFDNLTDQLATATAQAAGNHPLLQIEMLTMLQSQACRDALNGGDVPFWSIRGNTVLGEDGAVQVPHLHHSRLDTQNNNEINANARRAPANFNAARTDFANNAQPLFGDIMTAILNKHQQDRTQAGHGPPAY